MSYTPSTCTPACWTPEKCDTCGRRISPNGRSVPLEATGGYCTCDPEPATRAHLWDEHDDARHYSDPQGWSDHAASCTYCQERVQ